MLDPLFCDRRSKSRRNTRYLQMQVAKEAKNIDVIEFIRARIADLPIEDLLATMEAIDEARTKY